MIENRIYLNIVVRNPFEKTNLINSMRRKKFYQEEIILIFQLKAKERI